MSDNSGNNNKGGPQFPFGGPNFPDFKPSGGWKYTLIYIGVVIIGIILFNSVFLNKSNSAIDFSEFKARIASGEIKRVELTDAYFTGYTSASKRDSSLSRLAKSSYAAVQDKVYRTVSIYDQDFIKLMDEKNVAYGAVPREGNAILGFIVSWVLPIAFL